MNNFYDFFVLILVDCSNRRRGLSSHGLFLFRGWINISSYHLIDINLLTTFTTWTNLLASSSIGSFLQLIELLYSTWIVPNYRRGTPNNSFLYKLKGHENLNSLVVIIIPP